MGRSTADFAGPAGSGTAARSVARRDVSEYPSALLLALLLHGGVVATCWIVPALIRSVAPTSTGLIGLPGPPRLADIEPERATGSTVRAGTDTRPAADPRRQRSGADSPSLRSERSLVLTDFELMDEPTAASVALDERAAPAPAARRKGPVVPKVETPIDAGADESSGRAIRIELREDFTPDFSAHDGATSDQFQIVKLVRPDYPREAFVRGAQGLVRLEVGVDRMGKVERIEVLETAEHPSLERAAREAMVQMEFRPYRVDGRPIPFTVVVPFRFRIVD